MKYSEIEEILSVEIDETSEKIIEVINYYKNICSSQEEIVEKSLLKLDKKGINLASLPWYHQNVFIPVLNSQFSDHNQFMLKKEISNVEI